MGIDCLSLGRMIVFGGEYWLYMDGIDLIFWIWME
jgi:hypothetical protein